MYAEVLYYDGPRSPELIAAAERAGQERITPLLVGDAQVNADHIATFVLCNDEGGEIVVSVMRDEASFDRVHELIMGSELLPGEDEALLPGPDRVERYQVVHAIEHGRVAEGVSP